MILFLYFIKDFFILNYVVFNIKNQSNINLIQGGRYDNLLSNLGAKRKIPAVGAAINLNSYDN